MTLTPELVELHKQACGYFVRRRDTGWTNADECELNTWLSANPVHRDIYDSLLRHAIDLQQVQRPRLASDSPEGQRPTPPPFHAGAIGARTPQPSINPGQASQGWRNAWRGPFASSLLSVAVISAVFLLTGGWYWWDNRAGYTLEATTGPHEIRHVDLPDGSGVTLNFDTTLVVRYYPRRRETVLNQGEAFFQVAANPAKPFTVDSGLSQVRVVGTAFNVRAAPPDLVVKVLEGKVEVRSDRLRHGNVLLLGPGTGVILDPADGRHTPVAASADTVGDWRHGQLVFEQIPLKEAAAELARYLGEPVRVEGDAQLAALPVSGMVMTRSPKAFLMSLPHLLPVRVQAVADGGWRIVAR